MDLQFIFTVDMSPIFLLQVKGLARDVHDKYFKAAQTQPRGVVAKLGNIVAQIERACQKQVSSSFLNCIWKLCSFQFIEQSF